MYKSIISILLFVTLAICQNYNSAPELKFSLSTEGLLELIAQYGNTVENMIKFPLDAQINYNYTNNDKLFPIKLQVYNALINQFSTNWGGLQLTALNNNILNVFIDKCYVNATFDLHAQMSLVKVRETVNVIVSDMSIQIAFRFTENTNYGWGFFIDIVNSTMTVKSVKITLLNNTLIERLVEPLLNEIKLILPMLFKDVCKSLNDKLNTLMKEPFYMNFTVPNTESSYILQINFPQGINVINGQYPLVSIPINFVSITNNKTRQVCPDFVIDVMPDEFFQKQTDIEIIIGSSFTNQLIWTIFNSQLVNLVFNNSYPIFQNGPLQLNTTTLDILFPGITALGVNKGVYLNISTTTNFPNLIIREGRLLASMSVQLQFIVDQSSEFYPQKNISDCTHCVSAITLNQTLFAAINLYTDNNVTIFGQIQDIIFPSVQLMQTSLPSFNQQQFLSILNNMINAFIPSINGLFNKGFTIPIQIKSVSGFDLLMDNGYFVLAELIDISEKQQIEL